DYYPIILIYITRFDNLRNKMGRKPSPEKQKQIPVALPPDLRASLDAAAIAAGISVGEEIRRRFRALEVDPATRELVDAILHFAAQSREVIGADWFAHPAAADYLMAAIEYHLKNRTPGAAPESEANLKIQSGDDAGTLGRLSARLYD